MIAIDVYIYNNNYFENVPSKQLDNVYLINFHDLDCDHYIFNLK